MRRLSSYGSKLGCQGNPRFDYVWYSNHQFQGSMILIHSYIHRNNSLGTPNAARCFAYCLGSESFIQGKIFQQSWYQRSSGKHHFSSSLYKRSSDEISARLCCLQDSFWTKQTDRCWAYKNGRFVEKSHIAKCVCMYTVYPYNIYTL